MRLLSLTLQGFKSFPDKTVINFDDGITAIVGPNGSGKSNITDAIRWVLGEMSTKTLRGSKMEDVIFDGAHGRNAMGFAEVSLTLDNADGSLDIDFSEVTVTRRYFRSGESEYMINGNPVRLKDINELFMDTGIGRDGYSIIGQGKIADIISAKSDERRQIFEEAAGISKFRYRKSESERKLEQTQENLLRLADIVSELEGRIEPLYEQSEKAQRYLELRDEKRVLEISLWLNEIDEINSNRAKIEQDCERAHNDLDKNEQDSNCIESAIDAKYLENQQLAVKIDELKNGITAISEKIQSKRNDILLIKNDIEHNNELIARLNSDVADNKNRNSEIDASIEEKNSEIESITEELEKINRELDEINEQETRIQEESDETEMLLSQINSQILTKNSSLADNKIKSASLENSIALLKNDNDRLSVQLDESADITENLKAEKKAVLDEIESLTDEKQSCNNIISGYQLRMDGARQKIETQTKQKNDLVRLVEQKQTRVNALIDMQKHFSGFYDSVKSVMQAKSRNLLRGVHGPVSDILKINEKYSVAIETALGGQIQNIIVDTDNDAKAAIAFLKNNKAGRATFLPIETMKGIAVSNSEFKGSGIIGVASSLVECGSTYRSIVDYLLGRICIVDNIDNAVTVAKASGNKYRVVTLDGQVVNAGGSLTGGSATKGSGILNRQNEIDKLSEELAKSEQQLASIDKTLSEISGKYNTDLAYIDGVNSQIKDVDDKLHLAEMKKADILNRLSAAAESNEKIIALISDNTKQIKNNTSEIAQLTKNISETEEEISALSEKADAISTDKEKNAAERQCIAEKISNLKLEILANEKDKELAENSVVQLISLKEERDNDSLKYADEIERLNSTNNTLTGNITEITAAINNLHLESENVNKDITDLLTKRDEMEKEISKMRADSKDITSLRENLIREAERLDSKKDAIETKYNGIIMHLFDEYELTLSDAQPLRIEIESISKASQRVGELKNKIKRLGDVNIGAIEEYKAVKERYDFLSAQVNDLQKAKADIENVIIDLTQRMKTIFSERFKVINERFKETFIELFGGGTAELSLNDPTDVLESGIEIKVCPPGKVIKHLSSLSGGEQTFVAIALYFAILKVRPAPFCVMDEIEAALDEVNTVRFADYLEKLTGKTQFIVVTHRRGTMEGADVLYGVTMQENGVSKMLAINVNEVADKLKLK